MPERRKRHSFGGDIGRTRMCMPAGPGIAFATAVVAAMF